MARQRDFGRPLLALLLLYLGIRHLVWFGFWLYAIGFATTAPLHALGHVLGLVSGLGACWASWLIWQRRPAAIPAVWVLAALATAIVLLQVAASESARQAWAQQWPLKLLFEGGVWLLVLGWLYRQQRRGRAPG
ncbi:MAG: hypothetical protein H7Z19_18715 [Chitinophagaceae bacterium]|nr:hypothetical protein [Rubrivivax sp.]